MRTYWGFVENGVYDELLSIDKEAGVFRSAGDAVRKWLAKGAKKPKISFAERWKNARVFERA